MLQTCCTGTILKSFPLWKNYNFNSNTVKKITTLKSRHLYTNNDFPLACPNVEKGPRYCIQDFSITDTTKKEQFVCCWVFPPGISPRVNVAVSRRFRPIS